MSTITTADGVEIFYEDWGQGPARRLQPRLAVGLSVPRRVAVARLSRDPRRWS